MWIRLGSILRPSLYIVLKGGGFPRGKLSFGAELQAFCRNLRFWNEVKGFLGGVGLGSSSQRIIVEYGTNFELHGAPASRRRLL